MNSRAVIVAVVFVIPLAALFTRAVAQSDSGPKVGDLAPDFSLKGSRAGVLLDKPLQLSDFRGQAVVIAFFPKSRTKG